jgi:hypothetical protein
MRRDAAHERCCGRIGANAHQRNGAVDGLTSEEAGRNGYLIMLKWLGNNLITLGLKLNPPKVAGVFAPVYFDRITLFCPKCDKGGMWIVPKGFKVAIAGRLLTTCEKGHDWSISGAYAEERKSHDN